MKSLVPPWSHDPQIRPWSNNPRERLNKEIRRRTDVVGIFPDRARLDPAGRRSAQTDEWAEQRRYMGIEILAQARQAVTPTPQEVMPTTAISA